MDSLQRPLFSWGNDHETDPAQARLGLILWNELEKRAAAGILSRIADKWQKNGTDSPADLDTEKQNELLNMATRLMALSDFILDDQIIASPDANFHLYVLIDINNSAHYTIQLQVPIDADIDPSKFVVKAPNVDGDNGMEVDGNHFALSINNRGLQAAIGINQLSDHPAIDMVAASVGGTTPPLTLGVAADHNSGYLRLVGGYGTWDAINNERAYVAPDNGALPAANSSRVGCIMVLNGLGYICEEIGGSFLWQPITGAPGATGAPGSPGAPGTNATCADCATPLPAIPTIAGHDRLCDLSVAITLAFQDILKAAHDILAISGSLAQLVSAISPLLTVLELGPISLIGDVAAALFGLTSALIDSQFNNSQYSALQCDLYCAGTANPAGFTDANVSALIAKIANDTLLDTTAKAIFTLLINAVGARGLSNALSIYKTATGDCSSCNCPIPGYTWQKTWDFKVSAYNSFNFGGTNGGTPNGWISGRGISSGEGGWILNFALHNIATADSVIGYAEAKIYVRYAGAPGSVGIYCDHGALIENLNSPFANLGGSFVGSFEPKPFHSNGEWLQFQFRVFDHQPGNEVWITELTLAGNGIPPDFGA